MTLSLCPNLILLSFKNPNPLGLYKHLDSHCFSVVFFSSKSRQERPSCRIALADSVSKLKFSSGDKYLKNPEDSDAVISFLKESGFSEIHIEKVIKRYPGVLSANLEQSLKPKIRCFQDLGICATEIAQIISTNPFILRHSAYNRLGPTIFELKSCGINCKQIVKCLCKHPSLFLLEPQSMKELVKRVDETGVDRRSKVFLYAVWVLSTMTREKWNRKFEFFRSLGFSEDEITSVFRKSPVSFTVHEQKVKEVTQLLLGSGKFNISDIVNHPMLLYCSIENTLKPRLQFAEVLESRNSLGKGPRITSLCLMSKKRFEQFALKVVRYNSDEVS